jgi:hypothetical protein
MVSETEVRAKTDSELLEIWANQKDYIAEMVTRVNSEIERRNLDISGIHITTAKEVEDKKEAAQVSWEVKKARGAALFQGAVGLFMVWVAFYTHSSEELLVVPISILAAAMLLIFVAVGVWRGKRWAFTSGVVLYTLATALNILATILTMLAIWGGHKPGDAAGTLLFRQPDMIDALQCAIGSVFSGSLALIFNSLRKRSLVQGLRKSGEVGSL